MALVRRLTAFAIAAIVIAVPIAAAHRAGAGDEIAYLGNRSVYLIKANGTERRQLIPGTAGFRVDNWGDLGWSPDGKKLAFTVGNDPSNLRIYIADSDGKNGRPLTGTGYGAYDPTWSPDGTRIAFTRQDKIGRNIALINADGTGLHTLVAQAHVWVPDWSPLGTWILFDQSLGSRTRLMEVHPDGTGLREVGTFNSGGHCLCADWSPDGKKIAFQATVTPTSGTPELYVMNADGSGRIRLTQNTARDENPDWSPDGKQIAFYSERRGNAEIYVISAAGGQARRITHDAWYSDCAAWRPTGQHRHTDGQLG